MIHSLLRSNSQQRTNPIVFAGKKETGCSTMSKWAHVRMDKINHNWIYWRLVEAKTLCTPISEMKIPYSASLIDWINFIDFRRYLRLAIEEVTGPIIESSTERLDCFARFRSPKTKEDVINMLGDQSGKQHSVFCENGGREFIKTIAVGT